MPVFEGNDVLVDDLQNRFGVNLLVDPVEAHEDNAARIRLYGEDQARLDDAIAVIRDELNDEYRALNGT